MFSASYIALTSLVKFAADALEKGDWSKLNDELKKKLAPINHHINRSNNPSDIIELGNLANITIRNFLLEHPEEFEATETSKKSKFQKQQRKTLEEATNLKKELRKKAFANNATEDDRKRFRACLRAICDLKKAENKKQLLKTSQHQESLYFKNKWDFAKNACKGTLGSTLDPPGFSNPWLCQNSLAFGLFQ